MQQEATHLRLYGINEVDDVMNEYVAKQREADLEKLIQEES